MLLDDLALDDLVFDDLDDLDVYPQCSLLYYYTGLYYCIVL
jgi:hypothetical protein